MAAITKLKEEFFTTEFVKYKSGMEGQCVSNDGTIFIGNRAGPITWPPSFNVSNLVHEMSHLVEINDERMRCYGWGLKLPEVWVYDRMCVEPTTHQITDRELRVMAYQANVLQYISASYSVRNLVGPLEYLADTTFVPMEDGSAPYGENRNRELNGSETKASQMKWRINEVNRYRKEYTLDRFVSEWRRKMNWLSNHQYTID